MNITHYIIGLPKNRNGGAAKYAFDLILEQSKIHSVSLITYGDITFLNGKQILKCNSKYKPFKTYKLNNPMTASLLFGVNNPNDFLDEDRNIDINNFEEYYNNVKPDIIHIHTLMGLTKSFIHYFKSKKVKLVYTSHDYYGL